ncbi:MAG: hypothetical protein IAG13_12045, partial [Deltaproteobacteria bacterium]|nr:hypothetical protein [Nannocystaceae bacterium]
MNDEPTDTQFPELEYVRELAKMFKEYELDELEIEAGDRRILLRQADYANPPPQMIAAPAQQAAPAEQLASRPAEPS